MFLIDKKGSIGISGENKHEFSFQYSYLFFAYHAKKRNKRKITTDDNPQLPFSHKPTLTMARQLMVRAIRGHPHTSQDPRLGFFQIPNYYAIEYCLSPLTFPNDP
jgi:hypothetical protein